jgi:hypothetical protein
VNTCSCCCTLTIVNKGRGLCHKTNNRKRTANVYFYNVDAFSFFSQKICCINAVFFKNQIIFGNNIFPGFVVRVLRCSSCKFCQGGLSPCSGEPLLLRTEIRELESRLYYRGFGVYSIKKEGLEGNV